MNRIKNICVLLDTDDKKTTDKIKNKMLSVKMLVDVVDELDETCYKSFGDNVIYKIIASEDKVMLYGDIMIVKSLMDIIKAEVKDEKVKTVIIYKFSSAELMGYVADAYDDDEIVEACEQAIPEDCTKVKDLLPYNFNDVAEIQGVKYINQFINGQLRVLKGRPTITIETESLTMRSYMFDKRIKVGVLAEAFGKYNKKIDDIVLDYSASTNADNKHSNSKIVKDNVYGYMNSFATSASVMSYIKQYCKDYDCHINLFYDAEEIEDGSYNYNNLPVEPLYRILVGNKFSGNINYNSDISGYEISNAKGSVGYLNNLSVYDCDDIDGCRFENCNIYNSTLSKGEFLNCNVSNSDIKDSEFTSCGLQASVTIDGCVTNNCNVYCTVKNSEIRSSVIYMSADIDDKTKIKNSSKC